MKTRSGILKAKYQLKAVTYEWRIHSNHITEISVTNFYLHLQNSTDNITVTIWDGYTRDLSNIPALMTMNITGNYSTNITSENITSGGVRSASPLIVFTTVPRSTFRLRYKLVHLKYNQLQPSDVVNIANTQPVLHQAFSISTLAHPVQVFVDVHQVDGMTGDGCVYGGLLFGHYFNYSRKLAAEQVSHTILYRDLPYNAGLSGAYYGPYCTTNMAVPLLGMINSLYLQTGLNVFVLYAFLPHYCFNLTIRFQKTTCEGIINPSYQLCRPVISVVIAKRYKVICTEPPQLIPDANVCLVIQRLDPYKKGFHDIDVFNGAIINISVTEIKDYNIEYSTEYSYCLNEYFIDFITRDQSVVRHITNPGAVVYGKLYNNVEKIFVYNKAMCANLQLLYYQIKINISTTNYCALKTLPTMQKIQSDYMYKIITKCLVIKVKVSTQVYVVSKSLSLYDPGRPFPLSYYLLYNPEECGRGDWNIYVINYNLWGNQLLFDFTTLESIAYFYRYGLIHDLIIELPVHKMCRLVFEFMQRKQPKMFQRQISVKENQYQVNMTPMRSWRYAIKIT